MLRGAVTYIYFSMTRPFKGPPYKTFVLHEVGESVLVRVRAG
jgi:hypothetical protein